MGTWQYKPCTATKDNWTYQSDINVELVARSHDLVFQPGGRKGFSRPVEMEGFLWVLVKVHFVSLLGREEVYTVKYGLNQREIPRAQAIFYRISRLES